MDYHLKSREEGTREALTPGNLRGVSYGVREDHLS
jgi:hypothetical protein